MDISIENRADWERRRKIRLAQVNINNKYTFKLLKNTYFRLENNLN